MPGAAQPTVRVVPQPSEKEKSWLASNWGLLAAIVTLVLGDDGYSLGVLFRGERAPAAPPLQPQISIADVEREFALGA